MKLIAALLAFMAMLWTTAAAQNQSRSPSTPKRACADTYRSVGGATYCLEVSNVSFKCREGFMDEGFEKCSVDISYRLSTDYNGDGNPNVYISCEAVVRYETRDGIMSSTARDSVEETTYLFGKFAAGDLTIDVRLRSFMDTVIRARLNDVTCRITNVFAF